MADAFAHHVVAERELLQPTWHASLGEIRSLASPMRFSATPIGAPVGAPLLGEHTEEVLRQLEGLDAARIAALAADGTVVCHQP